MTPTELAALPQFDGFPYLNTRLAPALYHITLLPADAPQSTLLKLARVQAHANQLDTCLLLNATCAIFFWPDGQPARPPSALVLSTVYSQGGTRW